MKRYKAVLFDLFSTVAIWQPERLPMFEWRGKTTHSTMGSLQAIVEAEVADASFETFVDALAVANEELATRRAENMREISSLERFLLALIKSGYEDSPRTRAIADKLSQAHMKLLADAVEIPRAHCDLLARLESKYRIALISNFDHGETARAILERDGAAPYFAPIVISDEHGWRKPHARIFTDTLADMGIEAADSLYVGDSPGDDIVGARGAGLDIAWVNQRQVDLPSELAPPDYEIRAIPELGKLLL